MLQTSATLFVENNKYFNYVLHTSLNSNSIITFWQQRMIFLNILHFVYTSSKCKYIAETNNFVYRYSWRATPFLASGMFRFLKRFKHANRASLIALAEKLYACTTTIGNVILINFGIKIEVKFSELPRKVGQFQWWIQSKNFLYPVHFFQF